MLARPVPLAGAIRCTFVPWPRFAEGITCTVVVPVAAGGVTKPPPAHVALPHTPRCPASADAAARRCWLDPSRGVGAAPTPPRPLREVEVAPFSSELSAPSEMDPPESFDMLVNVALVCVFVDAVEMLAPIATIPTARPVALELLFSSVFALKFSAPVVLMMPPLPFAFAVDESLADASVALTPMKAPEAPDAKAVAPPERACASDCSEAASMSPPVIVICTWGPRVALAIEAPTERPPATAMPSECAFAESVALDNNVTASFE